MEPFFLAFIPLFVAIDVFGVLPIFVALTHAMEPEVRRRLAAEATLTALGISLLFMGAGAAVFRFLGISPHDFRIGGGIVLLAVAVQDLLSTSPAERSPNGDIGIVPIGVPLIMGPAALTTILILVESHGWTWTAAALSANLLIVWLVFREGPRVIGVFGKAGARAVAKVTSLLLAGIAVMMIRTGVVALWHLASPG